MVGSTVLFAALFLSFPTSFFHFKQAFGWAYLHNWHNTWDQFYVYWICPFIGAIGAGWLFRAVFPPPPPPVVKQKKT